LLQHWKESVIVSIYTKADKTNIYQGITLLSTAYKILSNVLLARLTPRVSEIIGFHQCGFRLNRSLLISFLHLADTREKVGA
jgi:hypothetical protein